MHFLRLCNFLTFKEIMIQYHIHYYDHDVDADADGAAYLFSESISIYATTSLRIKLDFSFMHSEAIQTNCTCKSQTQTSNSGVKAHMQYILTFCLNFIQRKDEIFALISMLLLIKTIWKMDDASKNDLFESMYTISFTRRSLCVFSCQNQFNKHNSKHNL